MLGWIGHVCAHEAPDKPFEVFFTIPVLESYQKCKDLIRSSSPYPIVLSGGPDSNKDETSRP